MPKAPPPSILLKFQGRREWPLETELDDWGLTPEQQESYVEQFRKILDSKKAWREDVHDYFTLRRFLRARTYDLERATTMWLNHMNWQKEFHTETILQDFTFPERDAFVAAYPQGYHKLDKIGRPIYVQQIGKIDVAKLKTICSEERMLKFHIQEYERCRKVILPVCSRLAGKHLDQTFGIMDVAGVGMGHLTGEAKRLMGLVTKYDQDNYPEMLGHICIINAPFIFKTLWGMVKGFIDPRTQGKIEILGTNYREALLKWVDEENLPVFLGGKSQGSLLDDIGPWSDAELCEQIGVNIEELKAGKMLTPLPESNSFRKISLAPLKMAPSLKRPSLTHDGSFYSAAATSADILRRPSGVSHVVADEVSQRYAASLSMSSQHSGSARHSGTMPRSGAIEIISEATAATALASTLPGASPSDERRVPTLLDRIAAMEQTVKGAEELMRSLEVNGDAAGDGRAHSTRSAPEGSLLNRVETLEDALDALLDAQRVFMKDQRKQVDIAAARLQPARLADDSCCCCVM